MNKIFKKLFLYLQESGYILVETLVCVAILGLALTFVLAAFTSEINALRSSRNYTQASLLLEEKLCELEREGGIDITRIERSGNFPALAPNKFSWELEIEVLTDEDGSQLNIYKLTVVVSWDELTVSRKLSTTTYLRKKIT